MWGTFIVDAYGEAEREQIAEALEALCSPKDDYGFASGGVYCFWSLKTRLPLYVGRAVDLPDRFRQHNGLKGKPGPNNKCAAVDAFFADEAILGYSVLVRSTLSQTETGRRRASPHLPPKRIMDWIEEPDTIETEYEIAAAEGTAIRSHWLEHGELPEWNKVHGETTKWNGSMRRHDSTGDLFCAKVDSLLQARRTLRELADDPLSTEFELELHAARIWAAAATMMANHQLDDRNILEVLNDLPRRGGGFFLDAMRDNRYLLLGPWVASAMPGTLAQQQREAWTARRPMPPSPPPPPLRLPDDALEAGAVVRVPCVATRRLQVS